MMIISPKEVNEAYRILDKFMEEELMRQEIDPKIIHPIHYTQENIKRIYPDLTNDQDKINEVIWNIYKRFGLYAPKLDFVTDSLLFKDVKDKSFYVINGKITEMFIDRTTIMNKIIVGKIGNQGIFFTRDETGAKKLYNELEKWVAEQDIGNFIKSA